MCFLISVHFSLYLEVNDEILFKRKLWLAEPMLRYPIGVKGLLLTVPESTLPSSRTKGCKTPCCVPQIFDDPPQTPNIHKHYPYPSTYIQPQHEADYTGADPMLLHLHFKTQDGKRTLEVF